jgi:hypothetical protein
MITVGDIRKAIEGTPDGDWEIVLHKIPAGATITVAEERHDGAHIEYQSGTKLTHVNVNIGVDWAVNVDVLECDSKDFTMGLG